MRIRFKPLMALRAWFIVAFIVTWNAACILALGLNGWSGTLHWGPGVWVASTQLACTSLLALAIVVIPSVREALTEPKRRELYSAQPFVFIAILTGVMAVVVVVES